MSDTRDREGRLCSGRRKVRADGTLKFDGVTYKVLEDLVGHFLNVTVSNYSDSVNVYKGTYPKNIRVEVEVVM